MITQKQICLKIDEHILCELTAACDQCSINRNRMINRAINFYLKAMWAKRTMTQTDGWDNKQKVLNNFLAVEFPHLPCLQPDKSIYNSGTKLGIQYG